MNWHRTKTSRTPFAFGPAAIIAGCMFLLATNGCRVETPPQPTATKPATTPSSTSVAASTIPTTVTLEIYKPDSDASVGQTEIGTADYIETFDVADGTTLEEVMRKIEQPEIVITGSGVTAFVQSIDGVTPESSRGWTFTIDDEFANEGIGSVKLAPPQTIRWRFTTLEEATK